MTTRADEIIDELFAAFMLGEDATDAAINKIIALEGLVRDLALNDGECMEHSLWERIKKLVPGAVSPAKQRVIDQTNYFDEDGTMRNPDGSRSIFDDVDQ